VEQMLYHAIREEGMRPFGYRPEAVSLRMNGRMNTVMNSLFNMRGVKALERSKVLIQFLIEVWGVENVYRCVDRAMEQVETNLEHETFGGEHRNKTLEMQDAAEKEEFGTVGRGT